MLVTDSHPQSDPLSSTSTSAESIPPKVIAPHQSKNFVFISERDSLIKRSAIYIPSNPIGKFIRQTDLQPKLSISAPPSNGPKTIAAAKDDDQIPSACARSLPSLKVTAIMAIAVG